MKVRTTVNSTTLTAFGHDFVFKKKRVGRIWKIVMSYFKGTTISRPAALFTAVAVVGAAAVGTAARGRARKEGVKCDAVLRPGLNAVLSR